LFSLPERGLAERLYRIRARTVLVWGEHDRLVPPADGQALCDAICDAITAELVHAPAAAHMVTVEQPKRVVAALTRLD
jgi:pimeloyl-ACP methyl ester carboxylesterase